ncbi:class I tRNA ligase family protein [Actinobacillus pleuropneumoniae]|nr:class I tRNA ligase family protein [Actinobacillus pleuropneumoniae]UQZ25768.1 class I tRNA ligase family protein [Actinobacillus pleuropneumoniae]
MVQRLMRFCSIEMGSFYLDIIKDRQYTTKADSLARRSCQTALWHIAEALVRWMAPILSFTADEIWSYLPQVEGRSEFVFTEEFYEGLFGLTEADKLDDAYWQQILKVRAESNRVLEQARKDKVIGSGLEAKVTLYANNEIRAMLEQLGNELRFVLITSQAIIKPLSEADVAEGEMAGLAVKVERAEGEKMPTLLALRNRHRYTYGT